MLCCVKSKLPDVGPAGSVGQCQDGGFIFGQTRHYSKDYIFYTVQNFPAANRYNQDEKTDKGSSSGSATSVNVILQNLTDFSETKKLFME